MQAYKIGPFCLHGKTHPYRLFPPEFEAHAYRCRQGAAFSHYHVVVGTAPDRKPKPKPPEAVFTFQDSAWGVAERNNRLVCWHSRALKSSHQFIINQRSHRLVLHATQDRDKPLLPHPMDGLLLTFLLALEKRGVSLHSSAVCIKNHGYAFVGPSGAGKSTLSILFHDLFASGIVKGRVLNDEKIIIHGRNRISGTPWSGISGLRNPGTVALRALFFLQKGSKPEFLPISKREAFIGLEQCLYAPYGWKKGMESSADYLLDLIKRIPVYRFVFTRNRESVEFFLNKISNHGIG